MKRHPALQDLSRDHHQVLMACQRIERAAAGHPLAPVPEEAIARFLALWRSDLAHHFDEEEATLVGHLQEGDGATLGEQLRQDHETIRRAVADLDEEASIEAWATLAGQLRAHIRWEENTLFPWLQDHLTEAQLQGLLERSVAFRTRVRGPHAVRPPRP
ncbi:MAG: hemerythrin domain-containing protein [Thermoplasmatota archaeon]